MLILTPQQVVGGYECTFWKKTAPTKIRPFTEKDLKEIGPFFVDLEKTVQKVSLDRCLCVGIHNERWTCSQDSLKRDRYPITEPDQEGFCLYLMKKPLVVACFDIPLHFSLLINNKAWESRLSGGIITWNQVLDENRIMRVVEREIFLKTYERSY